jgi:HSP20 family protein
MSLSSEINSPSRARRGPNTKTRRTWKDTSFTASSTYGSFQRTITVPYEINPDQVSAHFKDGVLKITLPKADAAARKHGRKIEVNKSENLTQPTPPSRPSTE